MEASLFDLAAQFGAPGLLIAFMVWDRSVQSKEREARRVTDMEQAKAMVMLAERIKP